MPYAYGSTSVFTTSGDIGGGRNYTRFKGPLLVGQVEASNLPGVGGPAAAFQVPHIANVSTSPADLIMNAGQFISTATTIGYVYIPVSTVGFSSSNTANVGPTPTPGILKGAAIVFDAGRKKLSVFSTDLGDWLSVSLTSS